MPSDLIGLAGEFATASELCRRGIYAQLTLGNRKKTDLLVDTGAGLRRIEVKTKQEKTWPRVNGVAGDDILVLVDFYRKQFDQRPDFYIVDAQDWIKFCREHIAANEGSHLNSGGTVVYKSGWSGASVVANDFLYCREQWEKIG